MQTINKKYFPSYSEIPDDKSIIVENILKYADIDDINALIKQYGVDYCKEIWIKTLLTDKRLIKLNYFLARFIFNISDDDEEIENFIKSHTITRKEIIEKLSN
jgi:hypothetical protein